MFNDKIQPINSQFILYQDDNGVTNVNVRFDNFKGDYITHDDVKTAKNYLSEKELQVLNLLVFQYLDFAELQTIEQHAI